MKTSLCFLAILAAINVCASVPTFGLGPAIGGGIGGGIGSAEGLGGAGSGLGGEDGGAVSSEDDSDGSVVGNGSDDQDGSNGLPGVPGAGGLPGGLPGAGGIPGLGGSGGSLPGAGGLSGGIPSIPGTGGLPGAGGLPGGLPGAGDIPGLGGSGGSLSGDEAPCGDNDPRYQTLASSVPGPIGDAFKTKDNVARDVQDAFGAGVHANLDGASQSVLNAADHSAVGSANIANKIMPGVGSAALAAYTVPSTVAHGAAKGVSKASEVGTLGITSGHVV